MFPKTISQVIIPLLIGNSGWDRLGIPAVTTSSASTTAVASTTHTTTHTSSTTHRASTTTSSIIASATSEVITTSKYMTEAASAAKGLNNWYNSSNGLWETTGWWNSANCLTMIADLAAINSTAAGNYTEIFANTLVKAQQYNLQMTKVVIDNVVSTFYWHRNSTSTDFSNVLMDTPDVVNPEGFLNGYYDDEGWWALGWIKAYDVTQNSDYLEVAIDIFNDMANASTPCGGIWWDKAHTYVNAIANELALSVAAHLANRVPSNKTYYLDWAESQWTWFQHSGMINSQHTINDGLNTSCANNEGTVWSYNQGVILGGLSELATASGDDSYLTVASTIATAAINALSDSAGILHDPCEPNCGSDGSQFKGIFMRNLQVLQQAAPKDSFLTFINDNANSIWANDRNNSTGYNLLGIDWAGPFQSPAIASTQSSAMDALVAAAALA